MMRKLCHYTELIKLIRKLAPKYGTWKVFEDFLAMSAISFSNACDMSNWEKREATYMDIVKQYEREELELFVEMLNHLVHQLQRHVDSPQDILGKAFHELLLHNKYRGQFFTPQNVCNMMGAISMNVYEKEMAQRGFVAVSELACGSGAMILGFAKALKQRGFCYNRQMVVEAVDVDLKCVHMCYLQLSLHGISAVVIHGNSLTNEVLSRWYTPVYVFDGWRERINSNINGRNCNE